MTHEEALELAAGYVLGALEADEERAVREHLGACPLPHTEFDLLGSVVPLLAESVKLVDPPAGLRDRVMAAVARDLEDRVEARLDEQPLPVTRARGAIEARSGQATQAGRFFRRPVWALAAAAALVIAVLGVWNVRLQGDLAAAQAYRDHVDQVLAIARQPGSAVAVLSGSEGDQGGQNSGLVAVGMNGSAAMVLRGLPPTTGEQVYEAWVIVGSSAPMPAGELSLRDGIAYLTSNLGQVPAGSTIALTREPRAGARTPTLPILASGVLAGAPS